MTICPKCSSCHITKPQYSTNEEGGEVLRYACLRCGYTENRPTHDHDKAPQNLSEGLVFRARH